MGNIHNYYYNHLKLRLSDSDYWDFTLNSDEVSMPVYNGIVSGDCLVVHYDFNESDIYASQGTDFGDKIYSLATWTGATNSGYTLGHIGLTGLDNGLITFDRDCEDYDLLTESGSTMLQENGGIIELETNDGNELLEALTGSSLSIPSGDTRLTLNRVTGHTCDYIYPIDFKTEEEFPEVGDYAQLCGGFYQGFYKLEDYDYQVLPDRVPKGWTAEVWLRRDTDACSGYTGTTLNDDNPDNAGFFLYFGTRAENKFWNIFEGNNTGCTSGCTLSDTGCTDTITDLCTEPKETDISIMDDDGNVIPLSPPPIEINEITNPFLLYHRGCGKCGSRTCSGNCGGGKGGYCIEGKTACEFTGGSVTVTGFTKVITDDRNKFLTFHRGCGCKSDDPSCGCQFCSGGKGTDGKRGLLACNFSGDSTLLEELDVEADVVDNALGFRIKDDGSIGYRLLTVTGTCSGDTYITGSTIEEEYTASGCVKENRWTKVSIKFVADTTYDECQLQEKGPRKGTLYLYVDCRLKLVVRDFDEFIARGLNEHKDKQLGVPYNISLGGGSQGLRESMTFDGPDPDDRDLPIEKYFAGTFIGGISQFRLYQCPLSYCQIKNNCDQENDRYRGEDTCFLLQENSDLLIQQSCYRIIIEKDSNLLLQEDGSSLLQENGFNIKWLP